MHVEKRVTSRPAVSLTDDDKSTAQTKIRPVGRDLSGRAHRFRALDWRRSISCHAVSHCCSATRLGYGKAMIEGTVYTREGAADDVLIRCKLKMRSFRRRHVPQHAKMSLEQGLESAFESDNMGRVDIAEGDEVPVVSSASGDGRLSGVPNRVWGYLLRGMNMRGRDDG